MIRLVGVLFGVLCLGCALSTVAGVVPIPAGTVWRQRWNNGTATLGGCTGGIYPNDNGSYPLGSCSQGNNASLWMNECWGNGLGSLTLYLGSSTCDPNFASAYTIFGTTFNGQQYCNVDPTPPPPPTYTTLQCSNITAPLTTSPSNVTNPPTQYITATYYPKPANNNCSGTAGIISANVTVGQCTPIGNNEYVLANCGSGLVTAVLYATSDCSLGFGNSTTAAITTAISPLGVFAQHGAASAIGKSIGSPGSDCANTTDNYISFTCFPNTTALPIAPTPSPPPATPTPTPKPTPTSTPTPIVTNTTTNGTKTNATTAPTPTPTPTNTSLNGTTPTPTATPAPTNISTTPSPNTTSAPTSKNSATHVQGLGWGWTGLMALLVAHIL